MRTRMLRSLAAAWLAVLLLGLSTAASFAEPESRLVGVININTATVEQLQLLPGIGPARARAIIAFREEVGQFDSVDGLTQVSGIGERALERIRSHCVLKGKTTAQLKR